MLKYIFDGMDQSRPWNKEKTGNNRRQNEFKQIDAGTAGSREHPGAQRFESQCDLYEHCPKVTGGELPGIIGIITNYRPGLDRLGRRGNCDRAVTQSGTQHSRAVGQTKTEPRHRTQHDKEAAQSYYGCGQRTMAKNFYRKPLEDRI